MLKIETKCVCAFCDESDLDIDKENESNQNESCVSQRGYAVMKLIDYFVS